MQEELFLAGNRANFYLVRRAAQETSFRVEPKTTEGYAFLEQMNGVLSSIEQHMRLHQYCRERFIPKVTEFNAKTGRLILTISSNLPTAIPTLLVDYGNYSIDYQHAKWVTKQAFQLASLAHEAGIVLSFSTENFLVCHESRSFVLLDWTLAQVCTKGRMDAIVAQEQVVELANLLIDMVEYEEIPASNTLKSSLHRFILEASRGAFLSATEALQVLNSISPD